MTELVVIKADEEALDKKQSEWDKDMAEKHRKLDEAMQAMHNGFGDVK